MQNTLRYILGPLYELLAQLRLFVRPGCGPGRGRRYHVTVTDAGAGAASDLPEFARELRQAQTDARLRAVRALAQLERELADQPGVALTVRLAGDRRPVIDRATAGVPVFPRSSRSRPWRLVEVIAWFRNDVQQSSSS